MSVYYQLSIKYTSYVCILSIQSSIIIMLEWDVVVLFYHLKVRLFLKCIHFYV